MCPRIELTGNRRAGSQILVSQLPRPNQLGMLDLSHLVKPVTLSRVHPGAPGTGTEGRDPDVGFIIFVINSAALR